MRLPRTIRAVVFDLGGVISTNMQVDTLNEVYGTCLSSARLSAAWWPLYVEATLGHVGPDDLWRRMRQRVAPGTLPTGHEEETWLSGIHLREPDVADTLAQLKARYVLGLLSNHVGRWARTLLERFDLERFWDAVVISSDIGVRKPDHAMYGRVCELLEIAPNEAVFIADEDEDLMGAQELGMFPVFIPGEDQKSKLGLPIERISDLINLL